MTYLTTTEAAERLRLCRKTIERMVKRGELDAVKVAGRLRIAEDSLPTVPRPRTAPPIRPAAVRGEFGQIARQVTGASKGGGR